MKISSALIFLFYFPLAVFSQTASVKSIPSIEKIYKPMLKRSCLKPLSTFSIDAKIPEGSGLAAWNGFLWTHNDSGDARLFAMDTTGHIVTEYTLPGTQNNDWEELSQDNDYFYLGAFGNNAGNRDTLQILRIDKLSLLKKLPVIDTIAFTWPETVTKGKKKKINFDCEAMVLVNDSIYLFTKEWKNGRRTRVFSLPAQPGIYTANFRHTLKTRILVTGASYDAVKKQLVLCGYNLLLRPFLLVFPQITGTDFFSNKGKKIKIRVHFRQVEGVATFDGKRYFIINEDFHYMLVHTERQLHKLEL